MRSRRCSFLALLVGSGLLITLPASCEKKQTLTEVEAPDEGLALQYDLTPGQTYGGSVQMRNSIQSPMGDIVQAIEFDVDLLMSGAGSDDKRLVVATIDEIGFDLRLPDGMPAAAAGGLTPELAAQLNGIELRFELDHLGEVSEMPEPPKDQPQQVQAMIQMIAGALGSSFVRLPNKAIKAGESWEVSVDPQPGEENLKRTGKGTFVGMARNDKGEDLVELELAGTTEGTMEARGQKQEVSSEQKAAVLFSTTAGFPAQIERTRNGQVPGLGAMFTEIEAQWRKGERREVDLQAAPEVQEITDPCDPDYVGPEACEEGEDGGSPAEGADAAAGEAEGTETNAENEAKKAEPEG